MTPAIWIDVGKSDATRLMRKRFKVALGCMAVRAQNELLIKRLQFIRNSPIAATQAAKAGTPRGHFVSTVTQHLMTEDVRMHTTTFNHTTKCIITKEKTTNERKIPGNERNGKHVTTI